MYVPRRKYQIKDHRVVCCVAKHTTRCSLIWHLHLDTCSVDSSHKIWQYSLEIWKVHEFMVPIKIH